MRETTFTKNFVTDGESRLLEVGEEQIIVTTLPWPLHGGDLVFEGYRTTYLDFVKSLLRAGRKIKEEESIPWIVLNHEPPEGTPLAGNYIAPEADFARRLIESAQPDFSLHGHIHEAPRKKDGSWIWQIGKTFRFNPGQSQPGELPHYIFLKLRGLRDWTAVWNGAGWILRAESKRESFP